METGYLASGNHFIFFFFRYSWQLKLIPPSVQQILYSGSCKLIFWLVETIWFQFLKYSFYWRQFFHLLEICFKRILYYDQWQRVFCLMRLFIHIFFGTITAITRRPIFKKILFLLLETVFFNFFRH